jgi:hypothetical protein
LTRRELRAELRAGRAIPVWLRFYGWDFCRCNGIIEGYAIPLSRDNAIFQARCVECGTSAEGDLEDFADGPMIEVGARPCTERGE